MIIFAKWRSHNGQLIFNESVTHEAERGIAISNWQPQPPKVVTSLSCGPYASHPSLRKSRSAAERDVMKRHSREKGFLYFFLLFFFFCFKNSRNVCSAQTNVRTYATATTTSAQCAVSRGTILRVAGNYVHWQSMKLKAIKQPRRRSDSVYSHHQLFNTRFDSRLQHLPRRRVILSSLRSTITP